MTKHCFRTTFSRCGQEADLVQFGLFGSQQLAEAQFALKKFAQLHRKHLLHGVEPLLPLEPQKTPPPDLWITPDARISVRIV